MIRKLITTKNKFDFEFKMLSVKDAGNDEVIIEGYANTSTKDRVGDVVLPKAFEKSLDTYMKNPVLLENHDWTKVAGRTQSAILDDKGLYIKARISDTRSDLKTLIREKCLSTLSIGYNELDADYDEQTKTKIIKNLELLEISVVSVPANTEASFAIQETKKPDQVTEAQAEANPKDEQKAVKVERHQGESLESCVSRGIQTLINEGKEPDQAAAIAYSMCGEKSGITSEYLKDFISASSEAAQDELDSETVVTLCDYFIENGANMKLNKTQLIEALKASFKSASAIPAASGQAPAEAGKADAPAQQQDQQAQAHDDGMKELMAKLDAIGQALVNIMEMLKQDSAEDSQEDAQDQQAGDQGGDQQAQAADQGKSLEELTDAEVETHLGEIEAQLSEIQEIEEDSI